VPRLTASVEQPPGRAHRLVEQAAGVDDGVVEAGAYQVLLRFALPYQDLACKTHHTISTMHARPAISSDNKH